VSYSKDEHVLEIISFVDRCLQQCSALWAFGTTLETRPLRV